ncbi:MAG TPA: hypothetical protein VKE74_05710 [Gemmataceae bacterium]|nr:hypothetical protein [Gemmataceae bacterium]
MPQWLPALAPLLFVPFWCFVIWMIGTLGGWGALARHYHHRGGFTGTRRRFCSARLGWSNYGGILTIGTNGEGLYFAVFFLFRPGHPPLFIPWTDVSAEPVKGWVFRYLEFRFAQAPGVVMRVTERLGRLIAADANRSWAEDRSDVE